MIQAPSSSIPSKEEHTPSEKPYPHLTTEISAEEESRYLELQKIALDFAREGETGELEKMIAHGLPVNLADEKGNTLLMLASYYDRSETVGMLLKKGAEVDRRNLKGQTPLSGAIFKGYLDVVKLLVEGGADIENTLGKNRTATQLAAFFGRQNIIDYLKTRGAMEKKILGLSVDRVSRISQTAGIFFFRVKKIFKH